MFKPKIKGIYNEETKIYTTDMQIGFKRFKSCMKCKVDKEKQKINIIDICIGERNESKYINTGYGTIMIKNLCWFAFEQNCYTITGKLSESDIKHRERQMHFFEKFGFEIKKSRSKIKDEYNIKLKLF